ncbi:poly-gamma-glutamate synthase PgsB [Candidatus Saccharibacteria bacterium]|nr:poly-gamma-glutamate synthase PgsB [Candidatus Saccharibacteria bacterium]
MYVFNSVRTNKRHERRMKRTFNYRVHVNGTRGKSSVTRLIAAALREGGIPTMAKTTGTAARIILGHTHDIVIQRKEANIHEQKRILDQYIGDGRFRAVVLECMAINPIYQDYLESKIMHSTIGIITNVRQDHVDMMGKTLPEIARSLANTIPENGHFVTSERNPALRAIFQKICNQRGTTMHTTRRMKISDEDMAGFSHFEYKSNVAIALKVAELCGIKREKALSGMWQALPDPGAFVVKHLEKNKKTIHWANLFAINDRESFILTVNELSKELGDDVKKAVILNNRRDRPERVMQFVDIAVNTLKVDYIFAIGEFEKRVVDGVRKLDPKGRVKVVAMGNLSQFRNTNGEQLFNRIAREFDSETLLFGGVNIHTPQAAALLEALERD